MGYKSIREKIKSWLGNLGNEKAALLDKEGNYRDLSSIVKDFNPDTLNFQTIEKIANKIKEEANKNYCLKEKKAGVDVLHHFERSVMLQIIDQNWRAHLSSLDQLRQGIGLRAYGQKDPKQEFKKEAFSLFEQLLEKIKFEIIRVLMLVQVKNEEQVNEMDKKNEAKLQTAKSDSAPKKVSRNDPCPCGSEKKYKHCHGKLI